MAAAIVATLAPAAVSAVLLLGAAAAPARASTEPAPPVAPVTMTDYTDPAQAMAWGQRSHWLQPWRSYLETVPATTLLGAIGINFNVGAKLAPATARLLGDSGFRRARIEVGWGSLEYDDPDRMAPDQLRSLTTKLTALKENGIRPLILLNANQGMPCPVKQSTIELSAPAAAGDTTIEVGASGRQDLVPGRTGISGDGIAAETLFTAVDGDGTVHLSRPLPHALQAGPLEVTTLRYEPFRPETLADGSPNPAVTPTLRGWLQYVGVVTREAKAILGSEDFDVEVWNELSFGSSFLDINSYYEPDVEWRKNGNSDLILRSTVEYLRDPAHGVAAVGIGNGFASESPWAAGSTSPVGLTAIDKHPYAGWSSFPEDAQVNGNMPLNGLGEPAGWFDQQGQLHETFTPTYDDFFPEHFLSGIQTETLVHDLSPRTSLIQKTAHGSRTHPAGGEPPAIWLTEVNLGPGSGPTPRSEMTAADIRHIETKDVLRYLAAYVNKGASAIDFYAASAGDLSLIDPGFLAAAKASPSTYPGDAAGGETTDAVRRLVAALHGAVPLSAPRRLSLQALTDFSGNVQFEGNGTPQYPPLYNREVFAFLPFQVTPRRFVVPVYVMTRDVAKVYRPDAPQTDPGRFDLPPEPYELQIGGVEGESAEVAATDPLSGDSVPVEVTARSSDSISVRLPVTDSPRLLEIADDGDAPQDPQLEAEEGEEETGVPAAEAGGAGKPASPARPRAQAQPSPPAPLQVDLEGGRASLRTGRLPVLASCSEGCRLLIKGAVMIGTRRVPFGPPPRDAALAAGASVRVKLAIGEEAIRLARRAMQRGSKVSVLVSAWSAPPCSQSCERVDGRVVLRR